MQLAWAAVALTLAPTLAAASVPAPTRRATPSPATPQGPDLFGGYSYTHSGDASLNGWDLSGSVPFAGFEGTLPLVADVRAMVRRVFPKGQVHSVLVVPVAEFTK